MQAECEGVPMNPDYQHLHNELWARQTTAIERASSAALAAAAEARDAASRQMPEFVASATRVRAIFSFAGEWQISTAFDADVMQMSFRLQRELPMHLFSGIYCKPQ